MHHEVELRDDYKRFKRGKRVPSGLSSYFNLEECLSPHARIVYTTTDGIQALDEKDQLALLAARLDSVTLACDWCNTVKMLEKVSSTDSGPCAVIKWALERAASKVNSLLKDASRDPALCVSDDSLEFMQITPGEFQQVIRTKKYNTRCWQQMKLNPQRMDIVNSLLRHSGYMLECTTGKIDPVTGERRLTADGEHLHKKYKDTGELAMAENILDYNEHNELADSVTTSFFVVMNDKEALDLFDTAVLGACTLSPSELSALLVQLDDMMPENKKVEDRALIEQSRVIASNTYFESNQHGTNRRPSVRHKPERFRDVVDSLGAQYYHASAQFVRG